MKDKEIEVETALVKTENYQLGTLHVSSPTEVIECASTIATSLKEIIIKQKLSKTIQGKEYVEVEGWSTLGAMLGVVPKTRHVKEIKDGIFEATVDLIRVTDQAIISTGIAECGSDDELDKNGDPTWAARPRYARKSMSITRATGKAFRISFSWIMILAGYKPTPYEEIVGMDMDSEYQSGFNNKSNKCPNCKKPLFKNKNPDFGNHTWYCYDKKGGCGKKFDEKFNEFGKEKELERFAKFTQKKCFGIALFELSNKDKDKAIQLLSGYTKGKFNSVDKMSNDDIDIYYDDVMREYSDLFDIEALEYQGKIVELKNDVPEIFITDEFAYGNEPPESLEK